MLLISSNIQAINIWKNCIWIGLKDPQNFDIEQEEEKIKIWNLDTESFVVYNVISA